MGLITRILNNSKLTKLKKEKIFFGADQWVTSIEKARFDEPVLVFYKDEFPDGVATFYLSSVHWGKIHRSSILLLFTGDTMTIQDVRVLENNRLNGKYSRGYGTLLMEFALEEAERRGIRVVVGDMAGNERGQRERQISYYTKFGFTIDANNKLYKEM